MPKRRIYCLCVLLIISISFLQSAVAPATSRAAPTVAYSIYNPIVSRSWTGRFAPMGISLYGWTDDDVATFPAEVAAAGGRWTIAKPIWWWTVEPAPIASTPGAEYYWSQYDDALKAPAAAGLQAIGLISINPPWARVDQNRLSGPILPESTDDFMNFVKAAVARYSVPPYNIQYWMIYAEVDCSVPSECNAYGQWGDDPVGYATLMQQLYPAVKSQSPDVKLVLGNLAMDRFTIGDRIPGPFARDFLERAMAAGLGNSIDVIAFNYFPDHAYNWTAYGRHDVLGKINYIRGIPGAESKALMLTEVGEKSMVGGVETANVNYNSQAVYVTKLYARTHYAGLLSVLYFSTREWDPSTGRALLDANGQPKPSYHAYQYYAATMLSTEPAGLVQNSDLGPNASTISLEGYKFRRLDRPSEMWLVWTDSATFNAVVAASQVQLHDKLGQSLPVSPVAGGFSFQLGKEPVYVEVWR